MTLFPNDKPKAIKSILEPFIIYRAVKAVTITK